MGILQEQIQKKLIHEFEPSHIEVLNESHMHSVPKNSETHFKVLVVSEKFNNISRVQRSRLINEVLKDELRAGVHALSQFSYTPDEWLKMKFLDKSSPLCHGKK